MSICLGVLKNSFQHIFPVLAQARFHSQPWLLGVFFCWLDVGWWFFNSDQRRLHTLATVTQQRTFWRYASRFQMDVSSYHRQKVLKNNWINKSHSKDLSQQATRTQTGNISINIHQFTSPFESRWIKSSQCIHRLDCNCWFKTDISSTKSEVDFPARNFLQCSSCC